MKVIGDQVFPFKEAPIAQIVRLYHDADGVEVLALKLEKHSTFDAINGYKENALILSGPDVGKLKSVSEPTLVWSLQCVSLVARPAFTSFHLEFNRESKLGELEIWNAQTYMRVRSDNEATADALVDLDTGKITENGEMPMRSERVYPGIVREWKLVREAALTKDIDTLASWLSKSS